MRKDLSHTYLKPIEAFSLLEILITILVISIALLGYAALQINAINGSVDTFSRTQAVVILEDAASRIRNNRSYVHSDKVSANAYSGNTSEFFVWCDIEQNIIPKEHCSIGSSCSNSSLAKADITQVCESLVHTKLPTAIIGNKCFDRDESDSDICSIGSKFSLFMAWKGINRADVTGKNNYSQTTRCQSEIGLSSEYACVQMEFIP